MLFPLQTPHNMYTTQPNTLPPHSSSAKARLLALLTIIRASQHPPTDNNNYQTSAECVIVQQHTFHLIITTRTHYSHEFITITAAHLISETKRHRVTYTKTDATVIAATATLLLITHRPTSFENRKLLLLSAYGFGCYQGAFVFCGRAVNWPRRRG